VNVEGSGNGADRLSVADEFPGQLLLIRAHFLRSAECHAARFGSHPAVVCSTDNERTLELGDACKDRHDHPAGRTRRVGPWLIKRL
jgi:hypothetical protein